MTRLLILAAGQGTRLRPHTLDRPKCLVPVAGRPLVDWQLDTARALGLTDVVIVAGYRADRLQSAEARILTNPDFESTNMVYTLWCARRELDGPVVVAYGDILYEPRVLRAVLDSPDPIAVAVDRDWRRLWERRFTDPLDDAESLRIDAAGHIVDIGAEVADIESIQGQYLGLIKFSQDGVRTLATALERARDGRLPAARGFADMYMTDLLQALIDAGETVSPVWVDRGWLEVDTVDDLALAETLVEADGTTVRVTA